MMSAEPPSKLDIISERYVLSQALLAATASVARCAEPDAVLRGPSAVLSLPQAPRIKLAWMRLGELDADILHPEYAVGSAAVYAGGVQISRRPEREECPVGQAIERWESVAGDIAPERCPVLAAIDNWNTVAGRTISDAGAASNLSVCCLTRCLRMRCCLQSG